jgi:(p)ppGpp synthase/HD superfamily hydrolase
MVPPQPHCCENSPFRRSATSIAAALLHDVVEDTPTTVKDIERILISAQLVEG